MGRRQDLERSIRESYAIIRDYERIIQTSGRPEEKLRGRRATEEQWALIKGYLNEYVPLVGGALPSDVAEIAAHFGPLERVGASPDSPSGGSALPSAQSVHASGQGSMAIGGSMSGSTLITGNHNTIVVQNTGRVAASSAPTEPEIDVQSLRRKLIARCDTGDLRDLCFVLGVDADNYPDTKDDFIRDLLLDLKKWDRVDEFVAALRREKSWVLAE